MSGESVKVRTVVPSAAIVLVPSKNVWVSPG